MYLLSTTVHDAHPDHCNMSATVTMTKSTTYKEEVETLTVPAWGRRKDAGVFTGLKASAMMMAAPLGTLLLAKSIEQHKGALLGTLRAVRNTDAGWTDSFQPTWQMHSFIAAYMAIQAIMYRYLPGPSHDGQRTPAGHLLRYKTNGFLALLLSCSLLAVADLTGYMKASFIASHWGSLLACLNIWGIVLTLLVYAKARLSPTHPQDRVFSGT